MLRSIIFICFCIMFSNIFAANKAPFSVSVFYESTDNAGNALNEADRHEDELSELRIGYDLYKKLLGSLLVVSDVSVKKVKYNDFYHLDKTDIALKVGGFYKKTNTFTAPRYGVVLNIGSLDVDSDIRDATYSRLTANYAKNFTDRVRFETGLEIYTQSADDSEVFDLGRQRLFINFDYKLSRNHTLYFTPSFMHGDVTTESGLSPSASSIGLVDNYKHGHLVDVDVSPEGFAVSRFDADTTILNLGYNLSLSRNTALDIAYRSIDSDADGISYETTKWSVGILSRF